MTEYVDIYEKSDEVLIRYYLYLTKMERSLKKYIEKRNHWKMSPDKIFSDEVYNIRTTIKQILGQHQIREYERIGDPRE